MNVSKHNTIIVLIASILSLYIFFIKDGYSKNISSVKEFYFEEKKELYIFKSGKRINLKFNFTWSICDSNKLPEFPEHIKKRTWEIRTSQILGDEIRFIASSSINFSESNTKKAKSLIIRKSNEIAKKYGICINNLKLHKVNGV